MTSEMGDAGRHQSRRTATVRRRLAGSARGKGQSGRAGAPSDVAGLVCTRRALPGEPQNGLNSRGCSSRAAMPVALVARLNLRAL